MDREDEILTEDGGPEESFEELLKQSEVKATFFQPGQEVEVAVIQVADEWVFIDTGSKSEGMIALSEFTDEDGNINIKEGDVIRAFFLSSQNSERLFTTKLSLESVGKDFLEDAFYNGIPVQGIVEKEIKGGFEIRIAGKTRAFCPFSQMGSGRIGDTGNIIGEELTFKVTEYSEKGKNIVLSNRAIIDLEKEEKKLKLRESLKVGMTVSGAIVSIKKFGAFVDVDGIEGLIPASEISWGHIDSIESVLSVGQEVDVAIASLDWDNDKFSFSLKEILPDPWVSISEKYPVDSIHKGHVVRIEKYGAFTNIAPGVDGLVHISELGRGKRINHPREVVEVGQELEVKIKGVDTEKRRLSLSVIDTEKDEEKDAYENYSKKKTNSAASFGTLGDLLKAKLGEK